MMKQFEAFQMPQMGQMNMDFATKSLAEWNKGAQAIAAEATNYTKQVFEEGTSAAEKIMGAKSVEQAMEMQASYAKHSYESYMGQMNKFAELYTSVAKDVYKPVEKALKAK